MALKHLIQVLLECTAELAQAVLKALALDRDGGLESIFAVTLLTVCLPISPR